MKNNLKVSFCGIQLENPCILASASPTQSKEGLAKAFKLGWAGVVTKTCTPNYLITEDAPNRFGVFRGADGSVEGFENFEGLTQKPVEYWEKTVSELKKEFPGKVVIASIMADVKREPWQDLARRMEAAGADAIELNLSCPHFRLEDDMGAAIGKSVENSALITAWVKGVVNIPVIAKLTPNVSDIQEVTASVVKAGADAIATINTVQGMIGVDIETLEPLPAVEGFSSFGGYSGNAVKPIGLRCVAQVAQVTDVPIHGIGGISKWQDIVEYYAVGASCVQICTEVMLSGYQIIKPMLEGLSEYVERKGLNSLNDITGVAVPKIRARERLNMKWHKRSTVVNPQNCTNCAKCYVSCNESGKNAISFVDKKVTVNDAQCDGCSLCTHVCPHGVLALS
ncbi:MAG: NAD-dependent dihydropyrimidine dehydrogenase subunit PreA [Negativicutes bacterium]|jgi:dihydropyrimidine dehydrogenase (NAD+) subunit PreA